MENIPSFLFFAVVGDNWRSGRSTTTAHLKKCFFHSLASILVNYRYEALEKLQLIKSEAHIDAKNVA